MVYQTLAGYYAIMGVSLLFVLASVFTISRYEKSWINWYTLPAAGLLATLYVLPAVYIWNFGTDASYFAFFFCYAAYALTSIATAIGYIYLPPIRWRRPGTSPTPAISILPWILLLVACTVYLPVLIEFREYLSAPREIYIRTRTGYGLQYYGSTLLANLAWITYLFKPRKAVLGAIILGSSVAALIYLHGSKGQLVVLAFTTILYAVYAKGLRLSLTRSAMVMIPGMLFIVALFAVFGRSQDNVSLIIEMASYSDYTRNAFKVIDDPKAPPFLGQLEFEEELYARIPRAIMPNKPKDFGGYRLALLYYPGWFYSDTGSPAFGIGEQYADFREISLAVLCLGGLLQGWFARSAINSFRCKPTPGRFLVLLFFAGVALLPLGAGYLLPEALLVGATLDLLGASAPLSGTVREPRLMRPLADSGTGG